jgi:TRAP-type C4-dicarboxylate transport system substrate-binding protein
MRLSRRTTTYLAGLLALPGLASCGGGDGGQEDNVTLTFVTAFPEDSEYNDGFWMWVEALEENAPWITVEYRGGPEIMAPTQLIEGVGSGAFDGASLAPDYYVEQAPAAELLKFTPFTPTEEREEGVFDAYEAFHADQLNVQYVGRSQAGIPHMIYLRDRKIDQPDLSGLTIRTSSAQAPVVRALGGAPVEMPAGEVLTALQRGAIDGVAWPSVGAVTTGIHEEVSFEISPRFYDSIVTTVINKDTFDGLDEKTQDAILSTMEEVEPAIFDHYQALAREEVVAIREAGVEHIQFTGEDEARILRAAYEDGMDSLDWNAISDSTPGAADVRNTFEAAYGDNYENAAPGGATVSPSDD